MVVKRQCSFCAEEIEPGTGMMFVKRDGTVFHFCSSSCRKQQLNLGRVGHRFKWTRAHSLKRAAERSTAERAPAAPPAPAKAARPRRKETAAPAAGTHAVAPPTPSAPSEEPPAKVEAPPETPAAPAKAPAKPRKPRTPKAAPPSDA